MSDLLSAIRAEIVNGMAHGIMFVSFALGLLAVVFVTILFPAYVAARFAGWL